VKHVQLIGGLTHGSGFLDVIAHSHTTIHWANAHRHADIRVTPVFAKNATNIATTVRDFLRQNASTKMEIGHVSGMRAHAVEQGVKLKELAAVLIVRITASTATKCPMRSSVAPQ